MVMHKKFARLLAVTTQGIGRLAAIRYWGALAVLGAIVMLEHPEPSQAAVTTLGSGLSGQLQLAQHGPVRRQTLTLPKLGSKTHHQQAQEFASRLVAGFGLRPSVALEFADWILEAAARQHLQPELVASLVSAESSFRKSVQSHVGAVGPAQVRPNYWSEFCGRTDLTDPEQNIYCGTQVLGYLLERCAGDQTCALAAYNIGINSKRRAAGLRYVAKIDRNMAQLRSAAL